MNEKKVISIDTGLYIPPTTKTCALCLNEKELSEFNKSRCHKHGVRPECTQCTKIRNKTRRERSFDTPESRAKYLERKKKYNTSVGYYNKYFMKRFGITYDEVKSMYDAQYGRCANRACGKDIAFYSENEHSRAHPNRACVDHDHETGKVRALLCMSCNTILGTLETKENIVLGLLEYGYKFNPTKDSRLFNLNYLRD